MKHLLLSLLITGAVSAAPTVVRVNLVHVEGLDSVSTEYAEQLFQETKQVFWREMRWKLRLQSFLSTQDESAHLDGLFFRRDRYSFWWTWLRHNIPLNINQFWYVMIPPIHESDGSTWIAGQASDICGHTSLRRAVFGNAQEAKGIKNTIVMVHELGHIFGASHDDVGANYMHPNAGAYAGVPLKFKSRAKVEMLRCLRRSSKARK